MDGEEPRIVLFVTGPSQDSCDRFFGMPTSLLYAIAPTIEAIKDGELELEYISKVFEPLWYVEGVNSDKIKADFRAQIESAGVEIICASATYDSLYPTLQLFSEAKKLNSNIMTFFGGPYFDEVHNLQGELQALNPVYSTPDLVDFAIAGDGEYALKAILAAVSRGNFSGFKASEIEGKATIYVSPKNRYFNGKVIKLETSGRPLDLKRLPFMPIEVIDKRHKYDFDVFSEDSRILPTVQMIASRGCRYACSYCSESRELAYPNAKPIETILQEVELRKKQGFKAVFFDDSTFGAYPELIKLLEELSETGIVFGSLNRFDHLTKPEIVKAYEKAGFEYVYCSVEQFDNPTLKEMGKCQKAEQIRSSIELLSERGFNIGVSLLFGFQYETQGSIKKTLDFAAEWVRKGTIKLVSESILSFHPGTPAGHKVKGGFNRTPPNSKYPFDQFEEGIWYHEPHVTPKYLKRILKMSEDRFKDQMVRNRHSWYHLHRKLIETGFRYNAE